MLFAKNIRIPVDKIRKLYYILITVIVIIIILITVLKYSRQRESIKHFLMTTKKHPTADEVYMHVKRDFPNISLGTVYRNLNLLTDIGEAVKISTPDGGDRFDGRTEPHNHFLFYGECSDCIKKS